MNPQCFSFFLNCRSFITKHLRQLVPFQSDDSAHFTVGRGPFYCGPSCLQDCNGPSWSGGGEEQHDHELPISSPFVKTINSAHRRLHDQPASPPASPLTFSRIALHGWSRLSAALNAHSLSVWWKCMMSRHQRSCSRSVCLSVCLASLTNHWVLIVDWLIIIKNVVTKHHPLLLPTGSPPPRISLQGVWLIRCAGDVSLDIRLSLWIIDSQCTRMSSQMNF